ncbi:MAG: glucose-1-phosphate cytidylyltransferase [Bryobacterales bacterium]|nr:glucose-1-phosphate cytidylyltransferase [Bryobacterales bacterium]
MRAVLLAGGKGTRLSEETMLRPKPMVEIGGNPILWHIMQIYGVGGIRDFIVACGYRGEIIKEYFRGLHLEHSDLVVDVARGRYESIRSSAPDWTVTLIDTGLETMTGGRIRRLRQNLGNEPFLVTYGDGLADIDIRKLIAFHQSHGRTATVTAVRPPARFGGLELAGDTVREFTEKPQAGEGWINGGFFVFQQEIFEYLSGDDTVLEREPLEELVAQGQLMAYRHEGFWQPMDTLREKHLLEQLWSSGKAPWKLW